MGVQVDGRLIDITHGRSKEWKQNVLSNTATESSIFTGLEPAIHTIKLYTIDPALILDRIENDMEGRPTIKRS
ncbi:hypothetical protein [Fodinibius salsisoli]|uniref:hypothetical protein n=1 Tax=Fodinibius salsisoli TaxID=2820877 RepID=UPI003313AF26